MLHLVNLVNARHIIQSCLLYFQRRDLTVSQVLIFVVLIFLVCHSLKLCLNFYEFSLTLFGKLIRWFNNLDIGYSYFHEH